MRRSDIFLYSGALLSGCLLYLWFPWGPGFDFIQYHSAFNLLLEGGNPYSVGQMSRYQAELRPAQAAPVMMWNPPWLLLIMSPVLLWDYPAAEALNKVAAILCALTGGVTLAAVFVESRRLAWGVLIALSFLFPLHQCLLYGQSSLYLALFATLGYAALCRERFFAAGALFSFLTVKPHLFYLVGIVLLWWMMRVRDFRFLWGALSGSLVLLLLSELAFPGAAALWLEALSNEQAGATPILDWAVANLTGAVRLAVDFLTGSFAPWPMAVVPGVTAAGTWYYLMTKRPVIDWAEAMPPLMALSLFTAPYGWTYDASVLLMTHAAALMLSLRAGRRREALLALLVITQVGCVVLSLSVLTVQSDFFFFSGLILLSWFAARSAAAGTSGSGSRALAPPG